MPALGAAVAGQRGVWKLAQLRLQQLLAVLASAGCVHATRVGSLQHMLSHAIHPVLQHLWALCPAGSDVLRLQNCAQVPS